MDLLHCLTSLVLWTVVSQYVEGKVTCECTTLDCQAERRRTCEAEYLCYVETKSSVVTRGCINEKSPLLCENRKPSKISAGHRKRWPFLYCCKGEDFCNRDIIPMRPTEQVPESHDYADLPIDDDDDDQGPYNRQDSDDNDDDDDNKSPCPNTASNDGSRLNPIYIAVPVAGVCVLLALVIFAMYILRRRNDFYAQYEAYQYHEHLARLANKQNEAKVQGCETSTNRCTDSERSSQGSETKLFLNA